MLTAALLALLLPMQEDEPAIRILKEAMAKAAEPGALERALESIDAEIRANPRSANGHYARGWILSRLKKADAAVASYDEAIRLKPDFADAHYNAGVVVSRAGRHAEAAARFDAAVAADPKHVDALYNGGQAWYNLKEFRKALDRWLKCRALAPDDFNCVKKVLQTQHALGDAEAAAKTRKELIELRNTSKDPSLRKLKSFCYEQFDVGKAHIYAYETFDPEGDLFSVYYFVVADASDSQAGSVNLESSAALREAGTPYVLAVSQGGEHRTPGPFYKEVPSLRDLKPEVVKLIEAHFASVVKGAP